MTDPAEVRASLLRGDSRDGCARRKVADQVKLATMRGAVDVARQAARGLAEPAGQAAQAMATAASAVVLASDLRAPELAVLRDAPDRCEAFGGIRTTLAEDFAEGMKAAEADDAGCSCTDAGENIWCRAHGANAVILRLQDERASTFERLANLERLLAIAADGYGIHDGEPEWVAGGDALDTALAEVRALLGGQ